MTTLSVDAPLLMYVEEYPLAPTGSVVVDVVVCAGTNWTMYEPEVEVDEEAPVPWAYTVVVKYGSLIP